MKGPVYIDRIEKKYQVGIRSEALAELWRDLSAYLPQFGLDPIPEITNVGSVYFDNDDCDLLSDSLMGRLRIMRLRTYETYGSVPEPISEYWVETKTSREQRRTKKRFRLTRPMLVGFLEGRAAAQNVFDFNGKAAEPSVIERLYREAQENVLTLGLKPSLLITYKRIAFQNELERLSIDWDVAYYHVTKDVYETSSWKYPVEEAVGKAEKIILELKYPEGAVPAWFADLQRRYPIWEKDYLKPIEGMGFLFHGPLRTHKKAKSFLPMIETYMADTKPLR
jgi:hypothetical protein